MTSKALPTAQPKTLERYSDFRAAVLAECRKARTLQELSSKLKSDPALKRLRTIARQELQEVFEDICSHVGISNVPVYLPVRKKIRTRGQAHTLANFPKEIRIYAIEGSPKPYQLWTPLDISCMTVPEVFETLMHEAAHILEADRHGAMSHDQNFVDAYETIERFVEGSPYSEIWDRSLRLRGAPGNSIATKVRNVSVPTKPRSNFPHQAGPLSLPQSNQPLSWRAGCTALVATVVILTLCIGLVMMNFLW